jgi:hypothetical protein
LTFSVEPASIESELRTGILSARKGSVTHRRRGENIGWLWGLPLTGLEYGKVERQIPMIKTQAGETIVIQYPGKESIQGRKTWKNPWDFRPKILKADNVDLTFAQIWDPLFDDLRSIEPQEKKRQVGSCLATLFYRMAYMIDYEKEMEARFEARSIHPKGQLLDIQVSEDTVSLGPFWNYKPPRRAVEMISDAVGSWAGMSFEAFLHYNSLLAWNEDSKCYAKFKEDWSAADPRGRINTLLTHIRVIGFILDEVRPSDLLGGFASRRGMSPAENAEIRRICSPFVA